MSTSTIKKKIHEFINQIEDDKILEAVYLILNGHSSGNNFELSADDIKVIEARKKSVKKGLEKTFTVSETKRKLLDNLKK